MRRRIFVSRMIPDAGLDLLKDKVDMSVWPGDMPPSRDELLASVAGCDGVICLLSDRIDAGFMDAAGPSLKVVSLFSAGFDNVDIEQATKRGILVTNTPDQLTETTAELALTLMMGAARRVLEGIEQVRDGSWKTWGPRTLRGHDLLGSTLGIIGMGRIGAALARRAIALGMKVIYYDPSTTMIPPKSEPVVRIENIETLFKKSDFISLHCPLTPATRHIINRESISLMKPEAVLVNTARGPCIDTDALTEALENNTIFAAGLDVTDPEPLPPDHRLASLPNCLVLPHIGSATFRTRNDMAQGAATNLLDVLDGRIPPDTLNPEARRQIIV